MERKQRTINITFEQFKKECKERGLKLLEKEYLGSHAKHTCLNNEGYKVAVTRNQTIRCNRKTMAFHEDNPHTLENIKKWFKEEQMQFELLDNQEYKNNRTRFKIKCRICEEIVEMTWANIRRKRGCGSCNGTKVTNYNSFEKRAPEKIIYLKNKEDAKKFTKCSGKMIKTVCPECGEESERIVSNLAKQGYGCTNCDSNSFYSLENRKKNKKEWEQKSCIVYTIKCWDDDEVFYKIGITTKTVKERFRKEKEMPYKYEVLAEIKTNLYEAVAIEFVKHKELKQKGKQYLPKKHFGGITECFLSID